MKVLIQLFLVFSINLPAFGQVSIKDEIKIVQREFYKTKNDRRKADSTVFDSTKVDQVKVERKKNDSICTYRQEPVAAFEGGMGNFYKVIRENLRFPRGGKSGRVFIHFVIDTTGKMIDFEIMKSVSDENSKEVLRVMDFINKNYSWTSTIQRGQKVNSNFVIPIVFTLDKRKKSNTEKIYRR